MRYTAAVLAALFCICGAVVVVTALTPTPTFGNTTADDKLIRTSAVGEVVSSPDRAEIQVGVQTENADVQVAQQQNAERMTNVTNAIRSLGIPDDHLTTTGYTVTPVYDSNPTPIPLGGGDQRKPTIYQVSNVLLVRIDDPNQVGAVIDAAVGAGANQVNSIAFLFSEEKRASLRSQAISQAVGRTRTDAETVASALGVRLLDSREVQVDPGVTPIYYGRSGLAADAISAPSTPIEPGTLKVTANVQVAWAYA